MKIIGKGEGLNAVIERCEGNTVFLHQEIRDSAEWWFFWAFTAKDMPLKEKVTFTFTDGEVIGIHGPAVSYNGVDWKWLGSESIIDEGKSFIYASEEQHSKVWFAFCPLYLPENNELFLKAHKISSRTLTISEQNHRVPYFEVGNKDGKYDIILTARHHACEATGNYVMDGVLNYLMDNRCKLLSECKVIVVPFVDYDGVVNGDQGKNRIPHDHNRDYIENPLYSTVHAIKEIARESGKKLIATIDFHSPWKWGEGNDYFALVKTENEPDGALAFSEFLRETMKEEWKQGEIMYTGKHDLAPGESWNTQNLNTSFAMYMKSCLNVPLSMTLETPYFGLADMKSTPNNMKQLGERFGKALERYIGLLSKA